MAFGNRTSALRREVKDIFSHPYATFHIEPHSGYVVMTDLSTVAVEDMALARDVLLRI